MWICPERVDFDLTYGGGFVSSFYLVNTGASPGSFTLSFYGRTAVHTERAARIPTNHGYADDHDSDTNARCRTDDGDRDAGISDDIAKCCRIGTITTTGSISGFEIFDYAPNGQEASVPLETRTPNSFLLIYDNTNGLSTGVALANASAAPANIAATIYDDQGNVLQNTTIPLSAHAQQTIILNTAYPTTAGKRGMVQFAVPSSGPISMIGIRVGTVRRHNHNHHPDPDPVAMQLARAENGYR